MKANEARENADKLNKSRDVEQYDKIIENIYSKMSDGEYHLWYYDSLRDGVKTYLEDLGYKISVTSERNETNWKIEW